MRCSICAESSMNAQVPTSGSGECEHFGGSAAVAARGWALGVQGALGVGAGGEGRAEGQRAGGAFRSRALKVSHASMSPVR